MPQECSSDQVRAYLDYAATAPFDARLHETIHQSSWANANALYQEGRDASNQIEDARRTIARALGAHAPSEITFTSGGSESDNTALFGLTSQVSGAKKTHVVVSSIEHDAVLNAAKKLKSMGFAVTKVNPNRDGVVTSDLLEACLTAIEQTGDAVCLVAVQAVNNEIGSVQPVRALARVTHEHGALFFTDAVQALGKLDINLEESGVDAAAFSAHKIGAFKGSGALYVRRGKRCRPLIVGGGQEMGMRSGTQNVMGDVVFARAVELACKERVEIWQRVQHFEAMVLGALKETGLPRAIQPTLAMGSSDCSALLTQEGGKVPHVLSLLIDGLEGETLVLRADNAGIALSAGSACSSGSLDPSHVLLGIGIPKDKAYGSMRVSFGALTAESDVQRFIDSLGEVLR